MSKAPARWAPIAFEVVDFDRQRLRAGDRVCVRGGLTGRSVEFEVLYHFDSVDQWLAFRVERGTSTEVDPALLARARGVLAETPGELLIREQMRATRYRRRNRTYA